MCEHHLLFRARVFTMTRNIYNVLVVRGNIKLVQVLNTKNDVCAYCWARNNNHWLALTSRVKWYIPMF